MDKNYVYIGMLLSYRDEDVLVIDKQVTTCNLLRISDRKRIDDVSYCELKSVCGGDLSSYNRQMRARGSSQSSPQSKFTKNDDINYSFEDGSKVWFTSDTHFFHENILKFCNRPFRNVEHMNECLIEAWNSLIGPDDTVFHLGDFCWGGSANWTSILQRLNGHIHLIIGNHDVKNLRSHYLKYFESISFQKQITVEGRKIYLNHYPLLTWGGIYRREEDQIWQLFGHVHSGPNNEGGQDSTRLQHLLPLQYDCGVDNNMYVPINFNTVKSKIEAQKQK